MFVAGVRYERERIIKLLESDVLHSIEMEPIILQAGMEPNWTKKHTYECYGCFAIAFLRRESNEKF
jgi:hypothetical protein